MPTCSNNIHSKQRQTTGVVNTSVTLLCSSTNNTNSIIFSSVVPVKGSRQQKTARANHTIPASKGRASGRKLVTMLCRAIIFSSMLPVKGSQWQKRTQANHTLPSNKGDLRQKVGHHAKQGYYFLLNAARERLTLTVVNDNWGKPYLQAKADSPAKSRSLSYHFLLNAKRITLISPCWLTGCKNTKLLTNFAP